MSHFLCKLHNGLLPAPPAIVGKSFGAFHLSLRCCSLVCVVCADGPTLTHGEMAYGAGRFAAEKFGAAEVVDPRPYLVGSLLRTHRKYPHLGKLIPAMGYFPQQIEDLETSINRVPCDSVIIATPMDLRKVVKVDRPAAVVTYEVEDREEPFLSDEIDGFVERAFGGGKQNGKA